MTKLILNGDSSEVSGVTNGSAVHPSYAPTGFAGTVIGHGGSVNFVPGSGVYFLSCCTNLNNAYFKFIGTSIGDIFGMPQGQIAFTITSRYSVAARTSGGVAFDVREASNQRFYFSTSASGGRLVFSYMAAGAAASYAVPAGTEEALFGSGVSLDVVIKWNGATETLMLNGNVVQTSPYTPQASNWTSTSVFDFGAYEFMSSGGYDAMDDVIGKFTVSAGTF